MAKRKQTELVSFKACVVETETYDNGNGKLYHAVLDSLPGQPKQQAQFFGLREMFKAGDVHTVTFSAKTGRVKAKVKKQNEAQIQAERAAQLKDALEKLEASQTVN